MACDMRHDITEIYNVVSYISLHLAYENNILLRIYTSKSHFGGLFKQD